MNSLMEALSAKIAKLSGSYQPDARAAGLFRIAYSLVVVIFPINYTWVNHVPAEFFNPGQGLQQIYQGIPPHGFVVTLQILEYATALWLLIGWRTFAASIALTVVTLLGSALIFSFSKVDHTILYQSIPIVMAAAGWGNGFSVDALSKRRDKKREMSGYPLVIFSVLIAFSMATAAAAKFAAGWWNPHRFGAWSYVADDYLSSDKKGALAGVALHHMSPAMWKLVDWGTLFAEGWLIIAIFSATTFRIAIIILPIFHISVYLMLDISFATFALVYIAFFLCAPRTWFPTLRVLDPRTRKRLVN